MVDPQNRSFSLYTRLEAVNKYELWEKVQTCWTQETRTELSLLNSLILQPVRVDCRFHRAQFAVVHNNFVTE